MTRLLFSEGAHIESRTDASQTHLHLAATQSFEEVVELLLSVNARAEARDLQGFTPLIIASTEDNFFVAQLILDHGARVDAMGNEGQTALLQAIKKSHVDVVSLLLKNGATVKRKGFRNRVSPLTLALTIQMDPIVSLILERLVEMSSISHLGSESEPEDPGNISHLHTSIISSS